MLKSKTYLSVMGVLVILMALTSPQGKRLFREETSAEVESLSQFVAGSLEISQSGGSLRLSEVKMRNKRYYEVVLTERETLDEAFKKEFKQYIESYGLPEKNVHIEVFYKRPLAAWFDGLMANISAGSGAFSRAVRATNWDLLFVALTSILLAIGAAVAFRRRDWAALTGLRRVQFFYSKWRDRLQVRERLKEVSQNRRTRDSAYQALKRENKRLHEELRGVNHLWEASATQVQKLKGQVQELVQENFALRQSYEATLKQKTIMDKQMADKLKETLRPERDRDLDLI